jgi:hypothetical protein
MFSFWMLRKISRTRKLRPNIARGSVQLAQRPTSWAMPLTSHDEAMMTAELHDALTEALEYIKAGGLIRKYSLVWSSRSKSTAHHYLEGNRRFRPIVAPFHCRFAGRACRRISDHHREGLRTLAARPVTTNGILEVKHLEPEWIDVWRSRTPAPEDQPKGA